MKKDTCFATYNTHTLLKNMQPLQEVIECFAYPKGVLPIVQKVVNHFNNKKKKCMFEATRFQAERALDTLTEAFETSDAKGFTIKIKQKNGMWMAWWVKKK